MQTSALGVFGKPLDSLVLVFQWPNRTIHNSILSLIGFPPSCNSMFRLPRIISPYYAVVHGPVTSVAFILTPVSILRPTCNLALNAKHYYSYLLPFGLLLQLLFLLISSSVVRRTIQNSKVWNQIAVFFYQEPVQTDSAFFGKLNWKSKINSAGPQLRAGNVDSAVHHFGRVCVSN